MSRVAVVTGGASGVGRSICEHLAAGGASVAVLDLDEAGAAKVADGLSSAGGRAHPVGIDVGDREAVAAALDGVRSVLGPLEILVTGAAISGFAPFEEISVESWDRMLRVNLSGTFHCIQLAIPDMVTAGWGRIVTVSSAAGQTGSVLQGDYSATKGGVIALTKTVALEYAAKGITANTIPPFVVDTPLFRQAQSDGFLPEDKYLTRMVPAGRLGTGDDIGAVAAFLCSDSAGYLTGQVIGVNGGAVT
jgi:NAD(P)-dependent dehydrogenase (short-subunit alcohol dehydrogenase family)